MSWTYNTVITLTVSFKSLFMLTESLFRVDRPRFRVNLISHRTIYVLKLYDIHKQNLFLLFLYFH